MKKIIAIMSLIMSTMLFASCGGDKDAKNTPIPEIDAAQIVTLQDASDLTGGEYTLKQETETAVRNDNESSIAYRPDPTGAGDPVLVSVKQQTESIGTDVIWNEYENTRMQRQNVEFLSGIGDDAYVAFPSIHVYSCGCEVTITAGSGSGDEQKELLMRFAQRAVDNLSAVMYPSEQK